MWNMTKSLLRGLLTIGLVLTGSGLLATAASAQPPMAGLQSPTREQLAMVRMWRLVSELEIDEAQATRVFPAYSQHQQAQQELLAQRQHLRKKLRQQLAAAGDDDELLAQMTKIRAVDEEIATLESDFEKRLSKMLSPRQQAQLILFEDTFRSDLRDTVRRMRGGLGTSEGGERSPRRRWSESP